MKTLAKLLLFLPALICGYAYAQDDIRCAGIDSSGKPIHALLTPVGGTLNIYGEEHNLQRQADGSYRTEGYKTKEGSVVYILITTVNNNTKTILQQVNTVNNAAITTVNLDCQR